MARVPNSAKPKSKPRTWSSPAWIFREIVKAALKLFSALFLLVVAVVFALRWVDPPITYTMMAGWFETGEIDNHWRDLDEMSINIALAFVAAEDANFCLHNGFDFDAIEQALDDGADRGASTISQQVAKNVFLWNGRSWVRKGLEVGFTVLIETLWDKRRILEVYLNVAETGYGEFGVDTAVWRHFDGRIANLSVDDAARIAVILPNPRERSPSRLTSSQQRRASQIAIGARTILADGRADCFLPERSP